MSITPVNSLEKYIETLRQSSNAQMEKDKTNTAKVYDDQINTVRDLYSEEVNNVGQQYADLERQNSIQKLINERAVAERAENLGLTDSGLNRTQQTAVQLSYSNAQSKIAQQKQAAIDSLNSQMNAKIVELEGNKSTALTSIENDYEKAINENAVSARNADLDSYTKLVESQNKALTEATNKRQAELREAKQYVLNYDGDKEQAIFNANNLYDLTEEELMKMLYTANITKKNWDDWWLANTEEGAKVVASMGAAAAKKDTFKDKNMQAYLASAFK